MKLKAALAVLSSCNSGFGQLAKDQALRRAKLRYLEQADAITARPVYWANFVLMGNSDPLTMTKKRH